MAAKTITANGATEIKVTAGKRYIFSVAGDFGGGTLTLAWSDGTNDVTIDTSTAGELNDFIAPTGLIKATLAGATSPDLLYTLAPVVIGTR